MWSNKVAVEMDLEQLIYLVHEHFDNAESFFKVNLECLENRVGSMRSCFVTDREYKEFRSKARYSVENLPPKLRARYESTSAKYRAGERLIVDFCDILGLDFQELFQMARLVRKWEARRDWQLCFPFRSNGEAMLEFIKKD